MQAALRVRKTNRPLILAMWILTVLSWVVARPFHYGIIFSCLFNLTANVFALCLIFSPVRTNILNGGLRLLLQFVVVLMVIVLLWRYPFTLDQMVGMIKDRMQ